MARIRNIKPDFFFNEFLAQVPAHGRLLFIGLWGLADIEGRLEDRPVRIKAALFAYEPDIDVEQLLVRLDTDKFIIRYQVDGQRLIWIPNFKKHQCFSTLEKKQQSKIPPYTDSSQTSDRLTTGGHRTLDLGQGTHDDGHMTINPPPTPQGGSGVVFAPDSPAGELLANIGKKRDKPKESPQAQPEPSPDQPRAKGVYDDDGNLIPRQRAWDNAFSGFWERYPKQRRKGRGAAEKSWHKLCGDEELYDEITWALDCQVNQPSWTKDNCQFVPLPATWLNQQRWKDEVEDIPLEDFTSIDGSRQVTYEEAMKALGRI